MAWAGLPNSVTRTLVNSGAYSRVNWPPLRARARGRYYGVESRPDVGKGGRADFVFDQGRNLYICPGGAELTSTGNIDQGHIVYYRASKNDCSTCSLKPKCTTAIVRKITRDLND